MSRVNILPILIKAKRLSILSAKYIWKENNIFTLKSGTEKLRVTAVKNMTQFVISKFDNFEIFQFYLDNDII